MYKLLIAGFISFCFSQYNMELVGYLGFEQDVSDITGFAQDNREFAVIGLQNSAAFVDITDPTNPYEIGRISGGTSIWRDLKYWNRHVYIGTEASDGVKVVSVEDPDNPVLVSTISDFTNSHNIHIDVDGYLYVVGASTYDIWIYDLSVPAIPQLIGTWNGEYMHDIEVFNNKIYGAGIYSGYFYIIDVSDKSNPYTLVSYNTGGGYISTHDCAVTYDEQYLFTADENTGGHIKVWDISDYNNINLVSEYMTDPSHSSHNIYIRPETNYLIISYYADGTRMLDISDPTNPIEAAYYDTSNIEGLYVGNWGTYAYLPSGYIISSDIETGLYVLMSPLILSPPEMEYSVSNTDFVLDNGEIITGTINVSNIGDEESTLNYNVSTSPFEVVGGSDAFGYYWSDSNMNEDISFNWIDISETGSIYTFPNNDNAGDNVSLGFNFPFYGEIYNSLIINPNGWIGFGDDNSEWDNSSIPSSNAPQSAIFGLWDDLNPENENCNQYCSGNVYYHSNADRMVIWFNNVAHWWTNFENSFYNFQIVLFPDGKIEINYNSIEGSYDATVGIQNSDSSIGMQISTGSQYINNNLSLSINSAQNWIDFSDNSIGTLEHNEFEIISFEIDSNTLDEGVYYSYININSNGGSATIPISLSVNPNNDYLSGDVNMDMTVNVLDIIITVNFVLGIDNPSNLEYDIADVNNDNILNILDIVNLVNIILN